MERTPVKLGRPRKYTDEEAAELRRRKAIERYYKNRDARREKSNQYYDDNKDKILAQQKQYRLNRDSQKKSLAFNPISRQTVLDIIGDKPKMFSKAIEPSQLILEVVEDEPELTLEVVEDEPGVVIEIIE